MIMHTQKHTQKKQKTKPDWNPSDDADILFVKRKQAV